METERETFEFEAQLECLTKPDGSAKFSIRDTQHLCAVYGPGEVKIAKELADRAYLSITYKPRIGQITNQEKVIEYSVKTICDGSILTQLHPRTAINIILQEIQTESNNRLACAINCVCLALLDASVPLRFNFAAVCCSLRHDNQIVFYPTFRQEKESQLTATFVFDSVENDLIFVNTSGQYELEQFDFLLKKARDYAVNNVFTFYNKTIANKLEFILNN